MIKATCKYVTIDEIPDLTSKKAYTERRIVNPIDYLFSFSKGKVYTLFGFGEISGILYVYIISDDNSYEIEAAPAVLFECDWGHFPDNWRLRMGTPFSESFEFIPKSLTEIENWFEEYIDEDPDVLKLVEEEIDRMRKNSTD